MYIIQEVYTNEPLPCNSFSPNKRGFVIFAIVDGEKYVAIPQVYEYVHQAITPLNRLNGCNIG